MAARTPVATPDHTVIGATLFNRYVVEQALSLHGTQSLMADVMLVRDTHAKKSKHGQYPRVALKMINKEHMRRHIHTRRPEAEQSEALLMQQLMTSHHGGCHENIARVVSTHETDDCVAIALEYIGGGDLCDFIMENGAMDEGSVSHLFRQLASAVAHIHEHGIAHRDIKPENILVQGRKGVPADGPMQIKLTDFGMARQIPQNTHPRVRRRSSIAASAAVVGASDHADEHGALELRRPSQNRMVSLAGTPGYTAPEMGDTDSHGYTESVDIWSLGVILYILLSGRRPYDSRLPEHAIPKFLRHNLVFEKRDPAFYHVSESAKDLIRRCLDPNEDTRITADEILQHPWVARVSALGKDQQPTSSLAHCL